MIRFLDLKIAAKEQLNDIKQAVLKVIDSGIYLNGRELSAFEEEFAAYCSTEGCVGVASGLDALKLSLLAWKEKGILKDGDEVLVPGNTFIATVLAILQAGLKPVLVDPDPDSFLISIEGIERYISNRSKVVIPVHLYGEMVDMKNLSDFSKSNNLLVLEDAAQAHGAHDGFCVAGSQGSASGFSFYPGKNLGAFGNGGAVVSNDKSFLKIVRALANYGSFIKYEHAFEGINSRLSEIQASILRLKLKHLEANIEHRRRIAKIYTENIHTPKVRLPSIDAKSRHVFHLFVIETDSRDSLQKYLLDNDVETLIHYPHSISNHAAFKKYKFPDLPRATQLEDRVLSLPIGPHVSQTDAETVSHLINHW
jgi:dTDP-4-amino-4,6-dideoxygalactose transaminase